MFYFMIDINKKYKRLYLSENDFTKISKRKKDKKKIKEHLFFLSEKDFEKVYQRLLVKKLKLTIIVNYQSREKILYSFDINNLKDDGLKGYWSLNSLEEKDIKDFVQKFFQYGVIENAR